MRMGCAHHHVLSYISSTVHAWRPCLAYASFSLRAGIAYIIIAAFNHLDAAILGLAGILVT